MRSYADWSPDCRAFERNLGRIAKRLKDEAFVGKINFNKQRDLVEQFGVTYPPPLPQFILYVFLLNLSPPLSLLGLNLLGKVYLRMLEASNMRDPAM